MTDLAMTPWKLLTASAALLAFLVGLYTLVGRERKSPHQINNVFPIFLSCLAGAVVDLVSSELTGLWADRMLKAGMAFLILATTMTAWRLYRLYFRFALFVDSGNPKYLWIARAMKARIRDFREQRVYEHHAMKVPETIKQKIVEILAAEAPVPRLEIRSDLDLRSAALHCDTQSRASSVLAKIAIVFLKAGYPVQYMTASRHPIEFVETLKASCDGQLDWNGVCKNIVVVDAYTRHFGFTDSIYPKATRDLTNFNVTQVTASTSYAGLHTASSRAFNSIKKTARTPNARAPALIIYEDSYALSDLESVEQYRIFVRHVLPSERLWEGMFTVFVETGLPQHDWQLLRSYASVYAELNDQLGAKCES